MTFEDLADDDFNTNLLSGEDSVRFQFAKEALLAGDKSLAERILSGDADDDYSPMRWQLFLKNRTEHGPAFSAEWDRLTNQV